MQNEMDRETLLVLWGRNIKYWGNLEAEMQKEAPNFPVLSFRPSRARHAI